MSVPLRYDPARPERCEIDTSAGAPVPAESYAPAAEPRVEAQAVVVSAVPTGAVVADCAEFEVRLTVTRPDGSRFDAAVTAPVDVPLLVKMAPGHVVGVTYESGDEQHISFVGGSRDRVDVVLEAPGDRIITVIKEIRTLTGSGLAEAKSLAENTPVVVLHDADQATANRAKLQLEGAGAAVTLK